MVWIWARSLVDENQHVETSLLYQFPVEENQNDISVEMVFNCFSRDS